ncbi:hypothetical protein ACFQ5D_07635 [Paenibacillus farraposensis]|uniref:Uncharacterized protein n=1 Tax=Paenibacillus farraposensis TaxID=2807095 RepID=A0ABW4DBT8_9BACL|nr:hypothetical protein [Paenibacillus farraposensis]MCC3380357.1 hypothetical protein [Paenibacillus farraposensis]
MTIAFIAVAVVAFIFLLVFNTKMARKSPPKARKSGEDSRRRSERPYPVQVEHKALELPDHVRDRQHTVVNAGEPQAEERNKAPDTHVDIKPARARGDHQGIHGGQDYGDLDYRAALRGFAGKGDDQDERSPKAHEANETPKSEDEQYREALRSMNRNK